MQMKFAKKRQVELIYDKRNPDLYTSGSSCNTYEKCNKACGDRRESSDIWIQWKDEEKSETPDTIVCFG